MKTMVIGCNGQLGHSLADTVPEGTNMIGLDLPELDITDAAAVLATCREIRPDVIVNAAAYTAVDKAESDPLSAAAVNTKGPRNIALAATNLDARLIHISTDFVFDGTASSPYKPNAATNPLSVYGRTKRDGELAVLKEAPNTALVIRTSWLYSKTGNNFVKTMLRLMSEREALGVVSDQIGTPSWAHSLAEAIWAFVGAPDCCGTFHWADSGETNWQEFALAIQEEAISLALLERAIPIRPIRTEEYPTAAKRPPYSVLDCSSAQKAINMRPVEWRTNLRRMLNGMAE